MAFNLYRGLAALLLAPDGREISTTLLQQALRSTQMQGPTSTRHSQLYLSEYEEYVIMQRLQQHKHHIQSGYESIYGHGGTDGFGALAMSQESWDLGVFRENLRRGVEQIVKTVLRGSAGYFDLANMSQDPTSPSSSIKSPSTYPRQSENIQRIYAVLERAYFAIAGEQYAVSTPNTAHGLPSPVADTTPASGQTRPAPSSRVKVMPRFPSHGDAGSTSLPTLPVNDSLTNDSFSTSQTTSASQDTSLSNAHQDAIQRTKLLTEVLKPSKSQSREDDTPGGLRWTKSLTRRRSKKTLKRTISNPHLVSTTQNLSNTIDLVNLPQSPFSTSSAAMPSPPPMPMSPPVQRSPAPADNRSLAGLTSQLGLDQPQGSTPATPALTAEHPKSVSMSSATASRTSQSSTGTSRYRRAPADPAFNDFSFDDYLGEEVQQPSSVASAAPPQQAQPASLMTDGSFTTPVPVTPSTITVDTPFFSPVSTQEPAAWPSPAPVSPRSAAGLPMESSPAKSREAPATPGYPTPQVPVAQAAPATSSPVSRTRITPVRAPAPLFHEEQQVPPRDPTPTTNTASAAMPPSAASNASAPSPATPYYPAADANAFLSAATTSPSGQPAPTTVHAASGHAAMAPAVTSPRATRVPTPVTSMPMPAVHKPTAPMPAAQKSTDTAPTFPPKSPPTSTVPQRASHAPHSQKHMSASTLMHDGDVITFGDDRSTDTHQPTHQPMHQPTHQPALQLVNAHGQPLDQKEAELARRTTMTPSSARLTRYGDTLYDMYYANARDEDAGARRQPVADHLQDEVRMQPLTEESASPALPASTLPDSTAPSRGTDTSSNAIWKVVANLSDRTSMYSDTDPVGSRMSRYSRTGAEDWDESHLRAPPAAAATDSDKRALFTEARTQKPEYMPFEPLMLPSSSPLRLLENLDSDERSLSTTEDWQPELDSAQPSTATAGPPTSPPGHEAAQPSSSHVRSMSPIVELDDQGKPVQVVYYKDDELPEILDKIASGNNAARIELRRRSAYPHMATPPPAPAKELDEPEKPEESQMSRVEQSILSLLRPTFSSLRLGGGSAPPS